MMGLRRGPGGVLGCVVPPGFRSNRIGALMRVTSWAPGERQTIEIVPGPREDGAAMDWLLSRQDAIEKKLAARHLEPGGLALFDLSSAWLEGHSCPLGAFGHSRDGKKSREQIEFGMVTSRAGIRLPSTRMIWCSGSTRAPNRRTVCPSTSTRPAPISSSQCLRLPTPASARTFCSRTPPGTSVRVSWSSS
jgi:hypothetical protein